MPQFEALLLNSANQTSKSMNSGDTDDALEYSHTSAVVKALKRVKREELAELPWDMLDIICKTLDFDDLFQFSGVCKSWRTFHKSNFLSSQQPLLVNFFLFDDSTKPSYSFINISNQKVYDLNIMSCFPRLDFGFNYIRISSHYFIMAQNNNSFVLFNPFTRIKKVINATFRVHTDSPCLSRYRTLLAFEKFSNDKEFVLPVLCVQSGTLYVYQSRHDSWDTYSTIKPEVIVDFVVFNNIMYFLTDHANIGVLNLNSGNIQFLSLKNTPKDISSKCFRLVSCDEQLLVVELVRREAYKIDLSSMNYIKMKSLGDIALFHVLWRNCYALSNPRRFGYESNYVYEVHLNRCEIYNWNTSSIRMKPYYLPGSKTFLRISDWCFRHLKYEVDYSLVE